MADQVYIGGKSREEGHFLSYFCSVAFSEGKPHSWRDDGSESRQALIS